MLRKSVVGEEANGWPDVGKMWYGMAEFATTRVCDNLICSIIAIAGAVILYGIYCSIIYMAAYPSDTIDLPRRIQSFKLGGRS